MLPVSALFAVRNLFHFTQKSQVFVLDQTLALLLVEIASPVLVLAQLLLHFHVVILDDTILLFDLILTIDFLKANLVRFVSFYLLNSTEYMLLVFLMSRVHISV